MSDDVLDFLERQGAFLRSQGSIGFLSSVGAYLEALAGLPSVAPHLRALREEAFELARTHTQAETRAVAIAFDIEKRHIAPIDARGDEDEVLGWASIKRLAEDVAHPAVVPFDPIEADDRGRAGQIIASVGVHLEAVTWDRGVEDASRVRSQFENARLDQHQRHELFVLATRVHAGVALLRLEAAAALLNRGGQFDGAEVDDERPALRVDVSSEDGDLLLASVFGVVAARQVPRLEVLVSGLSTASQRLELELRRRVGSVLSRLALVERFRARAEWHDRVRLYEIATSEVRAEEALRDEFARYLFDQGLDPLSEMRVGARLRADVVDLLHQPTFFVEAKRYDRGNLETVVAEAVRQAVDTANSLYAEAQPAEAFIVIFRTGGSRAVLPSDPIRIGGLELYARLIDIAPAAEIGSRARDKPRVFALEELERLAVEASPEAPEPSG